MSVKSEARRAPSARFDVFMSYNQAADHDLAEAIQVGLERFAKPWNQRRALRVFRDNSAMGVSPELWPAIVDSLDRSDWLVVLASPGARQSKWVNREIEHWLSSDRPFAANRLLLVLTDGDLVWDDGTSRFDRDRSSALPDSIPDDLYASQPRHLDMRWYRALSESERSAGLDLRNARFRSEIAEIAAPVHGVPKDELDSLAVRLERRVRRLRTGAIVGLAALSIVASILAVVATVNVNRAQRALDVSEARRSLLSSQLAPTQRDGILRAEEALARSQVAAPDDTSFVDGLFEAVTRDDLPLALFAGLNEPDSWSGGNRGMSFAPDGSAFAYVGTDDAIHVIDSWDLAERHVIALDDVFNEHERASPFIQTSFRNDGSELAIVTDAELALVTIGGKSPNVSLRSSITTTENPPLAATASPDTDLIGVLDAGMTFTVYDIRTGEAVDRFGAEVLVSDADLVRVAVSADQNRMCAVGGGVVRHMQVDPPALFTDVSASDSNVIGCWAEGCQGEIEAVPALLSATDLIDDVGVLVCLADDGTILADLGHQEIGGLALSRMEQGDSFSIDIGQGVSVDALDADATMTDAVFTMPDGQEWFAARVLQHATGPILVDYRSDGDIPVWRLARGLLPPADTIEQMAPSPGGGNYVLPPEDGVEPIAYFEDYTNGGNTISISQLPLGGRTFDVPRRGEPMLTASTSNSHILGVFSDGTAFSVDLAADAGPVEMQLPITGDVRTATYRSGILAIGTSDGALVFDVAPDPELQAPILQADSLGAPVCEIDVSANRKVLGVVLCPEGGPGEVLSIDIDTGEEILKPLTLRYSSPNSVSVTDDGETIVVAFILGQIGVRTGDEWVEPSSLSLGKSDHNDFQRGWAQVDPSGEFMVTRRDGDGVELWRVASTSDQPLARLTQYEFSEFLDPPDRVEFDENSVSVSWSNPFSVGYRRQSWPLSPDGLVATTCLLVGGQAGGAGQSCIGAERTVGTG
jgi:MTH538 TIR-like domain (DUF1863)